MLKLNENLTKLTANGKTYMGKVVGGRNAGKPVKIQFIRPGTPFRSRGGVVLLDKTVKFDGILTIGDRALRVGGYLGVDPESLATAKLLFLPNQQLLDQRFWGSNVVKFFTEKGKAYLRIPGSLRIPLTAVNNRGGAIRKGRRNIRRRRMRR